MLPPSFIQDLLSRVDIVQVVGRQVELRKAGINHKGLCPFHGEKTPSFIVSPSRQTYHCFGCGAHGDAIRFLVEQAGMGFMDAVRDLAQEVGVTVPQDERSTVDRDREREQRERQATLVDVLAKAGEHWRAQLKASPRAVDYLRGRGLSGEIAARFGLGYAPAGWRGLASAFARYDDPLLVEAGLTIVSDEAEADQPPRRWDRFRDRIMFPIRSVRGEVIGFGGRVLDSGEPKYLNSPETPVFQKGRELYGLFEARQAVREAGLALVVEGYMDVVALAQHGIGHAVATLGTACTADHVAKLFRFTDAVVFSFDGDAAGRRASQRALEAALPHATDTRSVRFLFLPPEHDPDSFVRAHGAAAFETALTEAVPLSRQLLTLAAEDCDLDTAEGRSRMLAQARPLWEALPDGLLRGQLLVDLAQRGATDLAMLREHWARQGARRPGAFAPAGGDAPRPAARASRWPAAVRVAPQVATMLDRAAWLLARQAALWNELSGAAHELLAGQPMPHGAFFAALERVVHDQGPLAPDALLDQVAADAGGDATLTPLLARLRALHDVPDDADPRLPVAHVLRELRMRLIDDELRLLVESQEGQEAMSETERARYQDLQRQRIALRGATLAEL
ncbi:MAG: DNA primase [Aquabacterium sp.]